MEEILKNIQNGSFADEFMTEMQSGCKKFNELRAQNREHSIEKSAKKSVHHLFGATIKKSLTEPEIKHTLFGNKAA